MHTALLEMGIVGIATQTDQSDAMVVVNQTMYDIFDAQDDDRHWRHKEAAELAAIYAHVRQEMAK